MKLIKEQNINYQKQLLQINTEICQKCKKQPIKSISDKIKDILRL